MEILSSDERLRLLTLDAWTVDDLMAYEGIKKAKAYLIKKEVLKNGGAIRFNPRKLKVETFFQLKGTSRLKEIELIKYSQANPDLFISANKRETL
jgi:hypothetical protein